MFYTYLIDCVERGCEVPATVEEAANALFLEIANHVGRRDLKGAAHRADQLTTFFRVTANPPGVYLSEYLAWLFDNLEGIERLQKESDASRLIRGISDFLGVCAKDFCGREEGFLTRHLPEMVELRFNATNIQETIALSRPEGPIFSLRG